MKKSFAIVLGFILCLCLSACSGQETQQQTSSQLNSSQEQSDTGVDDAGSSEDVYKRQTLSRQIADLEQELGVKLFTRSNHHIVLTEDGMILKRRAQEILSLADVYKRQAQRRWLPASSPGR